MIHGLTNQIRYQRAGKIYLGIRVKTDKSCKCGSKKDCHICMGTGTIHRPKETDYFVLKKSEVPELVDLYGEKPRSLNVMLPRAWELDRLFPQWFKFRGQSGVVKCIGDGRKAKRVNPLTASLEEVDCFQVLEEKGSSCPHFVKEECVARAILNIRITEKENSIKVYHISTGSVNSILNINTALREFIWFSLMNRVDISDIKLILKREEQTTQRLDKKLGKAVRGIHWPMTLDLDPKFYDSWKDVKQLSMPIPEKRSNIAIAALPESTEISDEDVLDMNGKIKVEIEEEKKEEEPGPEPKEGIAPFKQDLSSILEKFRKLGGSLTVKEEERVDILETVEGYEDAIKHFKVKLTVLENKEEKPKEEKDSGKPDDLFEGEGEAKP